MDRDSLVMIGGFLFSVLTASLGAWNAVMNLRIGKVIAELQLNLRREFNGRYVTLDRFNDLRDRVGDIEDER